ncbi:LPS export ABC transporter periplasmic protein LptC [Paramuribaculum intestinale]|uniref:LPS export ABC transporter periplasmic protein LptC n=1 Tax=Paramuribaculum intestinale TaxID=2094151 RepID=UPI001A32A524|nr:LPS export ABC transporter periplasmic protein LptC [Paramuribaculum intestinale]MBJ2186033.1 LPS export ABC transporter periplasmic protein LptC [Muribaculaceae bacterium]
MPRASMRILPFVAGAAVAVCSWPMTACGGDDHREYTANVDPEQVATMTTTDVSTLISDSGITRYRVVTPLWLVYDEARESRWRFPSGLHLERFDDFFNREATVDCDSATYFKVKQLWRLDGHVRVTNMASDRFLTSQLFWDQRRGKVYSDSFIRIERSDRIMEGYGFESNNSMTDFRVRNVSAILPVQQFTPGDPSPAASDSVSSTASVATDSATVRYRPSDRKRKEPEAASARPAPAKAVAVPDTARRPHKPVPQRPHKIKINDQQ